MKIVYLLNNTWLIGGHIAIVVRKANYLANLGFDVYIVTQEQMGTPSSYAIDERITCIDIGLTYGNLGSLPIWKRWIKQSSLERIYYKRLRDVLMQVRPDITISTLGKELSLLPRIKDGSKKILEIHTSFAALMDSRIRTYGFLGKLYTWYEKLYINRFDQLVLLTDEELNENLGLSIPIHVIPNPNPYHTEKVSDLSSNILVAIGRPGYPKNIEDVLHVWANLEEKFPDWRLRILGYGLSSSLSSLITSLNLNQDRIEIRPSYDVCSDLLESSVMVQTSLFEGLPLVLLEAQVCGLPMVAYKCKTGPSSIIKDGYNGYLVEVSDVVTLIDRLSNLMENETLRKQMGAKAKENSKLWNIESIMDQWRALFDKLIR